MQIVKPFFSAFKRKTTSKMPIINKRKSYTSPEDNMDPKIGLWIAVIGAGSAFMGALVSQLFNLFLKSIDYNRERFAAFLDRRIKAHENIIKVVYPSKTTLNAIGKVLKEGKQFLSQQEKFKMDIKRINKTIHENPLWPSIDILKTIGAYLELLKKIDSALAANDVKKAVEFVRAADNTFDVLITVCRKYSGADFLNRKMRPLVSRKWRPRRRELY